MLNQIDTVVFDKTGTLTEEMPHVGRVHACHGFAKEEVLYYAATAEYKQAHPIARAILEAANQENLVLPPIDEADYKVGYGITVTIDKQVVRVGSLRFIESLDMSIPAEIRAAQQHCHNQGHSLVLVAVDDQVVGAIELHATIRAEAKAAVQGLRQRGIKSLYIISGDHEAPTKRLAAELGIDHYFAETLPEQKASLIEQLQEEGKSVCYVGDGINDTIALKKAKVSVSLQGASTVAMDTAQVVLMNQNLNQLCELFDLTAEFDVNMKTTFSTVFIPHAIAACGVLLLDFDFIDAFALAHIGLFGGVASGMMPLLWHGQTTSNASQTEFA